jgi:hypothetical protein
MKQVVILLALVCAGSRIPASAAITLGTAETFAVLAGSTVTNTGSTDIKGNLGVSPGLAVVGFPPGIMLKGAIHAGDSVAAQAQADLTLAYNAMAALPCTANMTGQDLGGRTLTPGVYCFDSSAQLTGALVLDFQGSNTAAFLFKVGSALTTASSSTVAFANCTHHCSINWQIGSSATLGTSSKFSGNILALASITLNNSVYLCGRALAQTGAVTMDTDKVYFMGSLQPQAVEITGTGQIAIPRTNAPNPDLTGAAAATFSFTSSGPGEDTFFDYLNPVTALRVYGPVDEVHVIATGPDGSPKTLQFSGSCHAGLPPCAFSGTVEKNQTGNDRFGISVTGQVNEQRNARAVTYTPGANLAFYSTAVE